MKNLVTISIEELCQQFDVPRDVVIHFVQEEWISPLDQEELKFDEEDLARISLIRELQESFGVNDEAVPIILNLVDQLHYLRTLVKNGR